MGVEKRDLGFHISDAMCFLFFALTVSIPLFRKCELQFNLISTGSQHNIMVVPGAQNKAENRVYRVCIDAVDLKKFNSMDLPRIYRGTNHGSPI